MKKVLLTFLCLAAFAAVNAQENTDIQVREISAELPAVEEQFPRHSLSFGVGPAWISSKVMTNRREYSSRGGFEYAIEYGCVFRKGFGFGLSFMHNFTSYPASGTMEQKFIGPTFIYEHIFVGKWKLRGDISLGYTHYKDGSMTEGGVGCKAGVSMEYMCSERTSIGLKFFEGSVIFGDDDPYYDDRGIDRLGIMASLTFRL